MAKTYTFTAHIEDGHLKIGLRALEALRGALSHWRRCPVTITVEKQHAIRSLDQNAYYFGVVLARLSDYTGYTIDELHAWAKARFLPKHLALLNGNGDIVDEFVIGGATTKLTTIEFGEYVEAIRQFASEKCDLNIPDPNPNWRQEVA